MNNKKLRVIVFTQGDRFFIPTNIMKASKVCEIIEVVNNQCSGALENKLSTLIKWFGFFPCAKMGIYTILRIFEGWLDTLTGYRVFKGTTSIKHAAKRIGANYRIEKNINNKEYVEHVRNLQPDLIVSFSAPQVVKPELLDIPKYSVINVHGALLPFYRGLLPSFWYLFYDEKKGGATVHKMSKEIDDGDIINQQSIDISDCKTMFQLMKKTKLVGGELMVKTIQQYTEGTVNYKPNRPNGEGSYFTWPTLEQAKDFRKRGKSLI